MAYNELIKNFERIRDYMREFYVYGFKSREDYDKKSPRSYDDERRRIESWLEGFMNFKRTADGKNVFISIDSRVTNHNPLYKAWKTKSFTDGDITLHFILFDILHSPEISMNLNEIMEEIDVRLSAFSNPKAFDDSTVRKKLNEYISEGLIKSKKQGKTLFYKRTESLNLDFLEDAINFFSETAPCGVIGSYLLDKTLAENDLFSFKHHYITQTLDSEILLNLFNLIQKKCYAKLKTISRKKNCEIETVVVPLRIFISVQSGRQFLLAYIPRFNRISSFRLDNIISVTYEKPCGFFSELITKLDGMQKYMWGVSTQGDFNNRIEHVEFTVKYRDDEEYIHRRLEREKRCGNVIRIDEHTSKFEADVYDSTELLPWIRTFICRITDVNFSNKTVEFYFKKDIEKMYSLYEIDGGEAL